MRAAITLGLALAVAPASGLADPIDPRVTLLDRDASHARLWFWTLTVTYSVVAVAQTALAFTLDDRGLRTDAAVGATTAWMGVGGMFFSPVPRVWRAAADARRTGEIDAAIGRAAEAEHAATAWYNHLIVGGVAVGAGLVLWLGYDRPISAALAFAGDLLGGEATLLTVPRRAIRWRDRPVAGWALTPTLGGLHLVGFF